MLCQELYGFAKNCILVPGVVPSVPCRQVSPQIFQYFCEHIFKTSASITSEAYNSDTLFSICMW